ncbi:MAG TPA: DUF3052 family protein [Planctomycetaceae bacterium]|jgi:hypothetical protein|nr:DUF3052 family protein [Planctomycetaceae bacterium]
MGTEITGEAKYRRASYRVSLHLDSKTLTLRDELKLSIPLKDVRQAVPKDGQLTIAWNDDKIVLRVGPQSERLAKKILSPPTLLEKLGIKPNSAVSIVGMDDKPFLEDLRQRAGSVTNGRAKPQSDVIIVRVDGRTNLERLKTLRRSLKSDGMIWVLWRKGLKGPNDVKESDVMAAAKTHGLVDVKVASFSDELSALKLVIPVALR